MVAYIKDFFTSREKKITKQRFMMLMGLAVADDSLDDVEKTYLIRKGLEMGFNAKEIEKMFTNPQNELHKHIPLKNDEEKLIYLVEFLEIIVVNGEIEHREVQALKMLMQIFDIPPKMLLVVLSRSDLPLDAQKYIIGQLVSGSNPPPSPPQPPNPVKPPPPMPPDLDSPISSRERTGRKPVRKQPVSKGSSPKIKKKAASAEKGKAPKGKAKKK